MTRRMVWSVRALLMGGLGLIGIWSVVMAGPPAASAATTLIVNSTGDEHDDNASVEEGNDNFHGDGICDAFAENVCTLRAAIEVANDTPAVNRIVFSGDLNIQMTCAENLGLPPITRDGLTIDAENHTINIDSGAASCEETHALSIDADNVTIKGLRIGTRLSSILNPQFNFAIVIGDTVAVNQVTVTKSAKPCVLNSDFEIVFIKKGGSNITVRDCFFGVDTNFADLVGGNNAIHIGEHGNFPGGNPQGDILIEGNTIGFLGFGVDVNGTATAPLNLTIANNAFGTDLSGSQNFSLASEENLAFSVSDALAPVQVTIMGNRIRHGGDGGITIFQDGTFSITENEITHNNDQGIGLLDDVGFTAKVLMSRNTFGFNEESAIDLDRLNGVSCGPGDGGTPESNQGQRCPTISSATVSGDIVGSVPCFIGQCRIEVYRAEAEPNDNDHGEGVAYLGSTTVNANGASTPWNLTTGSLQNGQLLSATSTGLFANTTSEFGPNFTVSAGNAAVGGKNLGITPQTASIKLAWTGGTNQLAYLLARSPLDLDLLPASDTAHTDSTPAPGPNLNCYTLFPLGLLGPAGQSDFLCARLGLRSASKVPGDFTLRLNQSNTARLSWTHPGGQTSYALLAIPLDGSQGRILPFDDDTTSATDATGGVFTCYMLFAGFPSGSSNTDLTCGLPGTSQFSASAAQAAAAQSGTAKSSNPTDTKSAQATAERRFTDQSNEVLKGPAKKLEQKLRDGIKKAEQQLNKPTEKKQVDKSPAPKSTRDDDQVVTPTPSPTPKVPGTSGSTGGGRSNP